MKELFRNIKFLINLYRERGTIRSLHESGDLSFIKSLMESGDIPFFKSLHESGDLSFIKSLMESGDIPFFKSLFESENVAFFKSLHESGDLSFIKSLMESGDIPFFKRLSDSGKIEFCKSLLESGHVPFFKTLLESGKINLFKSLLESGNVTFLTFSPPGHFYSPIPDLTEIRSKSGSIFDNSARDIPSINLNVECQTELLRLFGQFYSELPFPNKKSQNFRYYFDNEYFSYGDAVILYSFLRYFSPKQVIEIGSGFSSALMFDTNDLFLNRETNFTFIEPFPSRLQSLLNERDKTMVRLEQKPAQDVELSTFRRLEANDILFVDSSHVVKINSDVSYIVFNILPQLKKGVIIHFHDILWPFEYPKNWIDEGRAWNEAYFLHAFLQHNDAFEIMYFNSYMALTHQDMLKETMPKILQIPSSKTTPGNSSLWLRKTT